MPHSCLLFDQGTVPLHAHLTSCSSAHQGKIVPIQCSGTGWFASSIPWLWSQTALADSCFLGVCLMVCMVKDMFQSVFFFGMFSNLGSLYWLFQTSNIIIQNDYHVSLISHSYIIKPYPRGHNHNPQLAVIVCFCIQNISKQQQYNECTETDFQYAGLQAANSTMW